jgi:UTP--glucose-1-phosphate uridylyltransferase
VTGRSKRAIEDHFDANIELENKLEQSHKDEFLKAVKKVNSLANIIYIRQPYPKGD